MLFLVIVAKQTHVTLNGKDYGFTRIENVFPNWNKQFFISLKIYSDIFYMTVI